MRKLLVIYFLFTLCSCSKNKIENGISGMWSIDTIYYKRHDIRECLVDNILVIKIGENSELPYSEKDCNALISSDFKQPANIFIVKSSNDNDTIPFRIKIETKNEIFSGIHKIVFYKDGPDKLLKMEIFSDNLYIVCRKGLFDYDDNINLMSDLEKLSWTNRP